MYLLTPRYELIANYPNSNLEVGSILAQVDNSVQQHNSIFAVVDSMNREGYDMFYSELFRYTPTTKEEFLKINKKS